MQKEPFMSVTSKTMAAAAGVMALLPSVLLADGPKFSGFVTGSYIYDLNDPKSGYVNGAGTAPGTTYLDFYGGRNASFKADAAHLTVTGSDSGGASYVIDFDAGTDGAATGQNLVANQWAFDLQQAYVAVPLGKTPLGFQIGKFYTSEGIEVGNSAANPTVTRGLAFGALEFTASSGALLTFKANDQISGAIGAVTSPFSGSVWGYDGGDGIPVGYLKIALAYGDPFSGTISAYFGPQGGTGVAWARENYLSLDLTGVNKSVGNLDLNFQGNYQMRGKAGDSGKDFTAFLVGVQPLYHMGAAQVGLRYEFLSMDNGTTTTSVNSVALAPGYKLTQSTLIRAEFRADFSSEKIYEDDKGAMTDSDMLVGGELNYTF
jgi:hypothetical protein